MHFCRLLLLVPLCLVPGLLGQDRLDKNYAPELPHSAPKEPADALKTFKVKPGFRVELVAAEPLIRSPVAFDFDENGRLFVVEFPEYNQNKNPGFKEKGRVRLLEDADGDGRFDKATTYVDNLDCPVAVACWDGGVFVGAVPDILFCKGETRKPIFTGFARDPAGEAMLNSFRWGLDNRFHLSTSTAGGQVRTAGKPEDRGLSVRGQGMLFDPRSQQFELTGGGGQHGMSMDDWGRTFVCDNSNPVHLVMYDSRYLARNPFVQAPAATVNIAADGRNSKVFRISPDEPWRVLRTRLRTQKIVPGPDEGGKPSGHFTGATGVTVYRGDAYPPEYRGNLFVGEVSGNLVYRARLEAKGIQLVAHRADKDAEFLASTDTWFRPVQFANGPDGCLYVLDMYREVIETIYSIPDLILKHLDVSAGVNRGRIYRIVPEGFKQPKTPQLGKATTAELVALLEHANGWHRDTASRLLYQRQDRAAVEPLKRLTKEARTSLGKVHALYALEGLNALEPSLILHALENADAHVREHALRLAERLEQRPEIRAKLLGLLDDPEPLVRYQLAFTLGAFPGEASTEALAKLALREAGDSWFRLAILSSTNGRAGDLCARLLADKTFRQSQPGRLLLVALAGQIGVAKRSNEIAPFVKSLDTLAESERALAQDLVRSFAARAGGKTIALGKTGEILAGLLRDARRAVADETSPLAERVSGVETLALAPLDQGRDLLAACLQVKQPPAVQRAVLETLARFDDPGVPPIVLAAWPSLSPTLRATALETLLARPAWTLALLDAVERGRVATADLDPARIQFLQASADATVKARAGKLFASQRLSKRVDVIAAYGKALEQPGDAARGKVIFKMNCAACHRLDGVGEEVGADLSAIGDKGKDSILVNILDPNREVAPKFLVFQLTTDAGRISTGMIAVETPTSLTLRRADGTSETLLRTGIAELRGTALSFMPEGLERRIDAAAMADLLAYLTARR